MGKYKEISTELLSTRVIGLSDYIRNLREDLESAEAEFGQIKTELARRALLESPDIKGIHRTDVDLGV